MKKNSDRSKAVLNGIIEFLDDTGDKKLLSEITDELEKEVQKSKGENEILVKSVVKLTPDQIKQIKSVLNSKFKIDFPLVNEIDTSLIGGFTIRVNDWFFDSSLKNEVRNFKRLLLE